jgi:hypothetical protein
MQKNFNILKGMFKKDSIIGQRVVLAESMVNQIYMTIMDKMETDELNAQFFDIIKDIKKDKNDK